MRRGYIFGFNGQEKDNEISGVDGGHLVFEYRVHDARLGRFMSVDPLYKEYAWNSTYAFAENDVIRCIDLEGLEKLALSGACSPEYYAPNGGTGYYPNQPGIYLAQAYRLQNRYGYHVQQVFTGQQIVDRLVSETKAHGQISSLAYFGHGGPDGFYLESSNGFYNSADHGLANIGWASSVTEVVEKVRTGEIKFTKNAVFFMDACNTAGAGMPERSSIAGQFTLQTGVTTIAATGRAEMVNEDVPDGRFKTAGVFYKFSRIEKEYSYQSLNTDKKWWEFWKPDTIEKKGKVYGLKIEILGKNVNVDDYVEH